MTKIPPADAGKTCLSMPAAWAARDHPRGCGENTTSDRKTQCRAGSPPQVRGKLMQQSTVALDRRITPADAGKTVPRLFVCTVCEDHPRGCGENRDAVFAVGGGKGSPPRMRGKLVLFAGQALCSWITPADAGKTRCWAASRVLLRDHPRGCGENFVSRPTDTHIRGSPPRMRGKLFRSAMTFFL